MVAVKFYADVDVDSKPAGIPGDWPAQVLLLASDEPAPDGFTLMSESELEAYTAERQSAYDTWKAAEEAPRRAAELIARAFNAAWAYVGQHHDPGAFIQMVNWQQTLAPDHPARALINAIGVWKDAVMFEYLLVKKPAILAGQVTDDDYSFIGAAPVSFTDLFLTINEAFRPPGWQMPDVSGYVPGTRQNPKP